VNIKNAPLIKIEDKYRFGKEYIQYSSFMLYTKFGLGLLKRPGNSGIKKAVPL
jgi:hypothetical protein